jgi:hypothetical protein
MLNVPGRSSGSWFVLVPAPSHLVDTLTVNRYSLLARAHLAFHVERFTMHVRKDSGVGGFRPHSQRRDREGFAPSSLTRKPRCERHSRRPC